MKIHKLKTRCEPFAAVCAGRKQFEFRHNDRGFAVGDILRLEDYSLALEEFTGMTICVVVDYMIEGPAFGVPEGFVVMSIRIINGDHTPWEES